MAIVPVADSTAKNVMYTAWDFRQYVSLLLFSRLRHHQILPMNNEKM